MWSNRGHFIDDVLERWDTSALPEHLRTRRIQAKMQDNQPAQDLAGYFLRVGMVIGELEHVRGELRELLFRTDETKLRDALGEFLERIGTRIQTLDENATAQAAVAWQKSQAS